MSMTSLGGMILLIKITHAIFLVKNISMQCMALYGSTGKIVKLVTERAGWVRLEKLSASSGISMFAVGANNSLFPLRIESGRRYRQPSTSCSSFSVHFFPSTRIDSPYLSFSNYLSRLWGKGMQTHFKSLSPIFLISQGSWCTLFRGLLHIKVVGLRQIRPAQLFLSSYFRSIWLVLNQILGTILHLMFSFYLLIYFLESHVPILKLINTYLPG